MLRWCCRRWGCPRLVLPADSCPHPPTPCASQVALLARPDLRSHPVAVAHSGSAPPPPRPQQTGVAPAAAAAEAAKRPDPAQAADHPALRGGPDQNGDVESGNESDATVALDLDDEPGGTAARAGPSAPAACSAHAGGLIAAPPSAPRGSGARPVVLRTGAVGSAAEGSGSSSGGYAGEISSANYVARGFGVRAGMGVTRARTLCPDLIVLPYDFPRIEAVSMGEGEERGWPVPGSCESARPNSPPRFLSPSCSGLRRVSPRDAPRAGRELRRGVPRLDGHPSPCSCA